MRILSTLLALFLSASLARAEKIEMVNNQPFDVRMPVTLRDVKHDGEASPVAQPMGKNLVVWVDVPASQSKTLSFDPGTAPPEAPATNPVTIEPKDPGVHVSVGGKDIGLLSWGVVVGKPPTEKKEGQQAPSTKRDFAAAFKAIPLKFSRAEQGPLVEVWKASGGDAGLKLDVELHAYRPGFLDIRTTVTNESAPQKEVYAAVMNRWEQPKGATRSMCYDNRQVPLGDGEFSPFRAGEGRYLYVLRGVDWINSRFADSGINALWLNDFTPSFTYHRDASGKKTPIPERWVGANTAQLGQEVQAKDGSLYSITEIARPNVKTYEARLQDNILPGPDQPLTIVSRLEFESKGIPDEQADQRFVAYTGFNPQQVTTIGGKITFGVPFTRMGTNYFPYSTLGENFGNLRMAGMSKDGYWPLAPQTVLQWEKFADDVRRDLRILKAMGFELCRVHHLELLWDKDAKTGEFVIPVQKRWEYLDFFFGEIEKLQLKVLLDVKLPPADVAELVTRYRKLCDGVEYDNEVMLFHTPVPDIPLWIEVRDAVKKVAPEMPFHLTVHTNTGAFDRIAKLGVTVDRIGGHSYMDSVDAIPTSRGNALALANYASKVGKEPQITEWNWRFLTRMSFEDRAKVYAPIFENPMAARCIPVMYQFQFQDSLAMNPAGLKGIRRYEQILLSRRPKPEAMVMMKLIEKYASPDAGVRRIGVERQVLDLTGDSGQVTFEVTNRTEQPMPVVLAVETEAGIKASLAGRREVVLKPGAATKVNVNVALDAKALPGFYHVFLRINSADDTLRYGWAEVRKPGNVQMDRSEAGKVAYGPGALEFDFNRPITVVYPDDASIMELESTWTVFITLESATGRPAEILKTSEMATTDATSNRNIVLVTREKDAKPSVRVEEDGKKLVVAGGTEQDVFEACMDLTVRYWKNAKDAGARKVGLVAAPAAAGGVKTDLD